MTLEKQIAEDYGMVLKEAQSMGCNKINALYNIPLDNMKAIVNALEEVQQYRAIGTPDECRAAVEKQKAKKPIIKYKQTQDCVTEVEWKCPICGTNYVELAPCGEWCRYCGTKFDWSDEE